MEIKSPDTVLLRSRAKYEMSGLAMNLVFTPQAWTDYLHWQSTDTRQLKRINQLLKEIAREPFDGIGKPEPLKHEYQGCWSRRIDSEHRVVYKVSGENVWLLQLRYHY